MDFKPGVLAKVKAGRDRDNIYVVTKIDSDYVYVADGVRKTVCNPKKKNKKHLQIIKKIFCPNYADDEAIRKCLNYSSDN